MAHFFSIQQTRDIANYVNEFELLVPQVTGIDEKNLEKIFYNGLKPEMKEVIRMKEPKGLKNHKAAVMKMQKTVFCKVMGDEKGCQSRNRPSQTNYNSYNRRAVLGPDKRNCNM